MATCHKFKMLRFLNSPISSGISVKLLLFNPDMVIVELNNIIIRKSKFSTIYCKSNDRLEIIRYIGGGEF